MGNATHEAQLTLHQNGTSQQIMKAVVVVKEPPELSSHTYIKEISNFQDNLSGRREHVEKLLMQKLWENYKNFDYIPTDSTIIFFSNWSPCKKCIEQEIPTFLRILNLKERSLRVKFRYHQYYARGVWVGNSSPILWTSVNEAENAYEALSNDYGDYSVKNDVFDEYNNKLEVHKRKLVFAKAGILKSSDKYTYVV